MTLTISGKNDYRLEIRW